MQLRPLVYGPPSPPQFAFQRTRDPMVHHFRPTTPALGIGVANYAYDTFAAPLQSVVGAGSGRGNSVIKPGAPPMFVRPVVRFEGLAFQAGQYVSSPLSTPPGA